MKTPKEIWEERYGDQPHGSIFIANAIKQLRDVTDTYLRQFEPEPTAREVGAPWTNYSLLKGMTPVFEIQFEVDTPQNVAVCIDNDWLMPGRDFVVTEPDNQGLRRIVLLTPVLQEGGALSITSLTQKWKLKEDIL